MTAGSVGLSGIDVRRAGRTILQIDGLTIPAGSFVGILGTNGAGKTTLLKICAGLIGPTRGQVRIDDVDLVRLSSWRKCALRQRIGYIPQSTEYNAELPFTLREIVAMGRTSVRSLLSRLSRQDYAIVDEWIDRLGLSDRRNQTFRSLSGGQQQKALIARAMTQDPELLMLDEPCANLDFHWKQQISEMIERLYRETNVTVLMVSHETSVLPPACERIVLMADGRIVADGSADEVLSPQALRKAYPGDFQTVLFGGRRYTVGGV
ncbi:MAG: ABC transporter ATP-binding protein [Sedimentisphaerales bacterium]|jgi:ABC-type cobalamin/Fe3+-siderophores transport system ATPase subunit|nr:ABC transporter ATP-binding protein [Sedimentisphaerales bacterium]HNY79725.1 ABC transporter ATP-binding protein [Sedimentisphaerales bacterium]HOC64768.1 ABC transporter ATP-binding protein [Sedimentisphaerales bacterium]HOH65714.1 ABC transporter ATP-binding protein [Sedimentisphaerales bacterium]HPY50515.1 ABC transporter ATP-binding protein [Sedimentisphaerales bacterium]